MYGKWVCALLALLAAGLIVYHAVYPHDRIGVLGRGSDVPVLVVDAGHGGFDGGAVGASGTTEQDINLQISHSVYALAHFYGYPAVMTRPDHEALDYTPGRSVHDNKVADIKARERFVNETENPVFLSIHLNKFEQSQYYGAQVFYSKNHAEGQTLAELTQASLISGIQNGNIRRAKPAAPAIYLMKRLQCPAVIVECGFLSNPEEERLLTQPDYQKRLAICVFGGYHNYLKNTSI